ncbi:hypothetical protein TNCV_1339851 [Trichonephila clavipes]|uniref:Uncharacterized protein n=1 Tax=Trichonephila clavipes TaxID=2585209 RepID=A0A8X6RCM3_TRICX|nr:hypothetical protein TNCV_1339851 [Trichonephila clavipes]
MRSKGHARLDAGRKGQSLQDSLFQAVERLLENFSSRHSKKVTSKLMISSIYVVLRLKPSSKPVHMLMLCGDLG